MPNYLQINIIDVLIVSMSGILINLLVHSIAPYLQ
jgi:predicted Co/Zn/Cd cation transporter (cation efflux family)